MDTSIFREAGPRGRKRVSPTAAKQFNGGYDNSTFRAEDHPDYRVHTVLSCRTCDAARPPCISRREYHFIEVGWTPEGIQAWCKRCESNVLDIDFAGASPRKVDGGRCTLEAAADGPEAPGWDGACGCPECVGKRGLN